jgi:hypothetical protein
MNDTTRKAIAKICLGFTIVWFALIVILETRYLISLFRTQSTFRDVLGKVYEEQIEGINFIVLFVYLIPGLFALLMYRRFNKSY